MSSVGYIRYPITTDPRELLQRVYTYIQSKYPGWVPAEGNLEVIIAEAFASESADIASIAAQVPEGLFRFLGQKLFGFNAINSTPATADSTWFVIDSLGYTIPAGTQVGIRDADGTLVPFTTLTQVVIPGGATQTAAGEVKLLAVTPGTGGNGLGSALGTVELIDTLVFVTSITQQLTTANGVDAETDNQYLDRLSQELQTLSPRPIVPRDFSILSRRVTGVQRALTINGYNPDDATTTNERFVCVFALDAAGQPVDSTHKTAIIAFFTPLREINFVVKCADASLVHFDVHTTFSVLPNYSSVDVSARVKTALMAFLNPAVWGIDPSDNPNRPITWSNRPIVNYLDLGNVIKLVAGVDEITALTTGLHGGSMAAASVTMSGKAPLPYITSADIFITIA